MENVHHLFEKNSVCITKCPHVYKKVDMHNKRKSKQEKEKPKENRYYETN